MQNGFPPRDDTSEPVHGLRTDWMPDDPAAHGAPDASGALAPASGVRWIAPGESTAVAGSVIERGFFYIGDTPEARPHPLDSCVVGTAHAVASEPAAPEAGPTAAWISYAALSPAQRRALIEWLASDRTAPGIHVGYLNLYLYGLERRVILDGARGEVEADEYEQIERELRRMLRLSGDWVFQTHVENLIEVTSVLRSVPARLYQQAPTVRATRGYQVPFSVRVAFGQAAVDNAPVPAEWAFAWASLDSAVTRKPPLGRVPEQFRLLFLRQYRARVRDGMFVSANRTRLKFPDTAFPALRELDLPESLGVLPDLSAVTVPRGRLQQLVNDCADELAAYGRYLVRNPGSEGTLDAALMLPPELWSEALRKSLEALADSTRESVTVTRFSDLLATFRTPATLGRDKIMTFVSVLDRAGIGIEPDLRLGARTPRADDPIALFAIDSSAPCVSEESTYQTAALMIDVAATLAMADGQATHPELTLMHHHIEHAMQLDARCQQRLKARLAVQVAQPQSLASLKKRLEPLSVEAKTALASFLVQTANADAVVTPPEVKLLEKIYRMLELDTRRLYSDLHHDASDPRTRSRKGHARPTGLPSVPPRTFELDAERIAALQTETAKVSAMLADVFVEEAATEMSTEPRTEVATEAATEVTTELKTDTAEPSSRESTLLGLDDAHSTFLRLLVSRPRWTRQQLVDAAADLELMLDGAIEQVNEASLDHWDEPLTDGDDPVEINQELAQRLAV